MTTDTAGYFEPDGIGFASYMIRSVPPASEFAIPSPRNSLTAFPFGQALRRAVHASWAMLASNELCIDCVIVT